VHEDAAEFLTILLPHLEPSYIPSYRLTLKEVLICRICAHSRSRLRLHEDCEYLSFGLPKMSEGVTLEQLWSWHFASEPVVVACVNQHSDHYLKDTLHFKRISIHTQPELLIIQLKRFDRHHKVRNKVFFPLILGLVQPQKSLQAVVVHLGASVSSGHYVTFVRTLKGGTNSMTFTFLQYP